MVSRGGLVSRRGMVSRGGLESRRGMVSRGGLLSRAAIDPIHPSGDGRETDADHEGVDRQTGIFKLQTGGQSQEEEAERGDGQDRL